MNVTENIYSSAQKLQLQAVFYIVRNETLYQNSYALYILIQFFCREVFIQKELHCQTYIFIES